MRILRERLEDTDKFRSVMVLEGAVCIEKCAKKAGKVSHKLVIGMCDISVLRGSRPPTCWLY